MKNWRKKKKGNDIRKNKNKNKNKGSRGNNGEKRGSVMSNSVYIYILKVEE